MAPEYWSFSSPAQVVERASLDAQHLGGLFDGKKGIVAFIGHGKLLKASYSAVWRKCRAFWSDSFDPPAKSTPLLQQFTIATADERETAAEIAAHTLLEAALPGVRDSVMPKDQHGDIAIAGPR